MRPLRNSARSEKLGHFDEVLHLSEPAYAGRPIGGERKSKDRKMDNFNERDGLCNGLMIVRMGMIHMIDFYHAYRACPVYSDLKQD